MASFEIRELANGDRPWVRRTTETTWGGPTVVVHGEEYVPDRLPGIVLAAGGKPLGVLTYEVRQREFEVVTLVSLREGEGIGTALLSAATECARFVGCRAVRLVTTNDNLDALRFFQRRGFRIRRVVRGAVEESRRIKPGIPEVGENGIPIRDEIEMELRLEGTR